MQQFGPFAVGIAMFAFLAVAAVAGIVADYKKRQIVLEPLRAAIERGQPLDPAVVERLMAREPREDAMNPLHLKVGGIITTAAGIGVAVLSYSSRRWHRSPSTRFWAAESRWCVSARGSSSRPAWRNATGAAAAKTEPSTRDRRGARRPVRPRRGSVRSRTRDERRSARLWRAGAAAPVVAAQSPAAAVS